MSNDLAGCLTCRVATAADLDAVADVWHEIALSMDGVPDGLATRDELRARIDHELVSGWDLRIWLQRDKVIALLALKPDAAILDQLFVLPSMRGRGVGLRLLECARKIMPEGFTLRTQSANAGARRFYERAGLIHLREGNHPTTGEAVSFYGWNADQARRTSATISQE